MDIEFFKYQGAGNDFVIIDNRTNSVNLNQIQIAGICDRKFGIGADGLMYLEKTDGYDFKMVYFNADGNQSTMCGNGGRCISAFAHHQAAANLHQNFLAIDGPHQAILNPDKTVSLQMIDVNHVEIFEDASILNTGSPHYVRFVTDVNQIDVDHEGRAIRNLAKFFPNGINVNFAQIKEGEIAVRTYERGVEAETLACGTGVTAVALAASCGQTGKISTKIQTLGGALTVTFDKEDPQSYQNIWLTGPAQFVFKGTINLENLGI